MTIDLFVWTPIFMLILRCFLDATFCQICDYTWLDRKWFLKAHGERGPYQNASIVLVTDSFVSLTAGWVGK